MIAHPAAVMEIEGKNALVLGGGGMVGGAVCRLLLSHRPGRLVVASRRKSRAQRAAEELADSAGPSTHVVPAWGDVFMRADWQRDEPIARSEVLADPEKRRRLILDILDPLDEDIVASSLLTQLIAGSAPGPDGSPAHIVVDCMDTATAVSYQNVYALAQRLIEPTAMTGAADGGRDDIEVLLASLYVPQLVRHIQILYEGMRRAGTEAYIKVGTSGTGGMGFDIPYTHSEERPSRLLLSKAALAGAQTLLTFLMARTPGGPRIVREIKPAALIGWREIGFGPVGSGGREIPLYDCPPKHAVSLRDERNLAAAGNFGQSTGRRLEAVYIDTGENGQFSAAEFGSITSVGQMGLVTPEEIAENVVREILGGNTGRDIVAALEGSVMGPSYRAGHLRQAALNRLGQLEDKYGEAVAFEILGPPRLSKLLYEAYLLKRACKTTTAVLSATPETLSTTLEQLVRATADLRQRIISIGIPILLSDAEHLLRGPVIKSRDSYHGWVDLTPGNMSTWQKRFKAMRESVRAELEGETSSLHDREFAVSREWPQDEGFFGLGEIVAWIFTHEDQGTQSQHRASAAVLRARDHIEAGHWEHFSHQADVGIRGIGPTREIAFSQAARAMIAAITDPGLVSPVEAVPITAEATDDELLLVDWLNAIVFEIATRGMLFSHFDVTIDGSRLTGTAWGEPIDRARHHPAVEVKGATYTALKVGRENGTWTAQCVVDV